MPKQTATRPNPRGRNDRERAAIADLTGATIHSAEIDSHGTLVLVLRTPGRTTFDFALIASDPEGNGPGSLHYYVGGNGMPTPVGGR